MTSIREMAQELGISKQALQKRIDNHGWRQLLITNGNQFAIDDDLKALILQDFSENRQPNRQPICDNQSQTTTNQFGDFASIIEVLQDQLKTKDEQLQAKDFQIEKLQQTIDNLTTALNTQQALQAGTMQQLLLGSETSINRQGWLTRLRQRKKNGRPQNEI